MGKTGKPLAFAVALRIAHPAHASMKIGLFRCLSVGFEHDVSAVAVGSIAGETKSDASA